MSEAPETEPRHGWKPFEAGYWAKGFAHEFPSLSTSDGRMVTWEEMVQWFDSAMIAARTEATAGMHKFNDAVASVFPDSVAWTRLMWDVQQESSDMDPYRYLVRAREIGQEEGRAEAIREIAEGSRQFAAPDASREGLQESPSTPQAPPHRCPMRALRVHFMDGSHQVYGTDRIAEVGGWKISRTTDSLVIGHGVPRIHLPLCNIKMWELVTEADL